MVRSLELNSDSCKYICGSRNITNSVSKENLMCLYPDVLNLYF